MDVQFADFVTIGALVVLEGLLSADNALVLAVMMLGLPRRDQRTALRYGLVGAFAFRTGATLLATYSIQMGWVKIVCKIFTIAYLRARRKGPVADDDPMADEATGLLADNHSS